MNDPKATQWLTKAGGLARRLEQARGSRSGLSLAKELGWGSSSKVTRIEQGIQIPSQQDVEGWARACGLTAQQTRELVDLLDEFKAIHGVMKQRSRRNAEPVHTDASLLIDTATLIRTYSTWAVPPVLQLEEYAVAVLNAQERLNPGSAADPVDALAGRMRRQELLYDKTRRFEILLDESVLYRRHGGPDILREQLDRLLPRAVRPNPKSKVRFGIVPFDAPVTVPAVQSIALYDEQVFTEGIAGDEVASGIRAEACARLVEQLWECAVEGEKARQLVLKAIAELDA